MRGSRLSVTLLAAALVVALAAGALTRCSDLHAAAPSRSGPGASQLTSASSVATSVAGDRPEPYDASQLDPRVTRDNIARTIGVSGYTKTVRPPASATSRVKRALMIQHGYTDPASDYELDHFIPLGVGGSSSLSNLWLEPIAEARQKDADELLAHENVTSGRWSLAQGQQYIRDHWRIHYAR